MPPLRSRVASDRSGGSVAAHQAEGQAVSVESVGVELSVAPVGRCVSKNSDFDAKGGDFDSALEWLAVARHHRELTGEYQDKRRLLRRAELERREA